MPLNDMSDLLSDPDFAVTFTIQRRFTSVATGSVQTSTQTIPNVVGCIQAPDSETLQQNPDLANIEGVVEIWTGTQLYGQTETTMADLILYQNDKYIVSRMLGDWQTLGGFTKALATLYDKAPIGPTMPAGLQPDPVPNV